MTLTGIVLIPLGLLVILLPWRYAVMALPIFATMDGAAVVNLGGFGLQPGYFFGLLVVGRTIFEVLYLKNPLNVHVLKIMLPLFFFSILCAFSIWIALVFFQGRIMVISGTAGLHLDLVQPYTFQRQNLTQPLYLLMNMAILYCFSHQMVRLPFDELARATGRGLLGAILFAGGVAVWEMARFYAGVPFAEAFFHSNVGYAAAYGQVMSGSILRTSGPFTEPAALAYHFAGFLFYAWYRYLERPNGRAMAIVLFCLIVMAASTSTTAFAVMGAFFVVLLKDAAVSAIRSSGEVRLSSRHLSTSLLLVLAAAAVYLFVQTHWYAIDNVLTKMVFEKNETSSFAQRTGVDLMALDIVVQTGGIGVGLGSHKPNNLLTMLLSNTGFAGFVTFGLFLFLILRPSGPREPGAELRPLRWLLIGLLIVHAMVNPNLSTLMLWVAFALVVGTRCHEGRAAGAPQMVAAPGATPRWPSETAAPAR